MATAKYNDKILDAIALAVRPTTRQLTFEGTIRSSKTVTAIEAFFWRMFFSSGMRFVVASYDMDTLNDNLLQADGFGLLTRFGEYCSPPKKDRIGGYYIEANCGRYGIKKISLCPYGNKAKWKKVLGGTIEGFLIDEANIADPTFIDECYARQTSCDAPFTIYTLNGDEPTAPIYGKIDASEIIGNCPASIRAQMEKLSPKRGYYYMHFTMRDNPVMTDDKIAAAQLLYPPESYYYKTKILGERGTPGKLIFFDYINESAVLKKLDFAKFHECIVSMDVGATRAVNSIALGGFTYGYRAAGVLDLETFAQCGYHEKTERLIAAIKRWRRFGAVNISCVIVDSAELNYIKDLQTLFRREGLPPVIGSYKATIKQRIDLICLLLSRGRFLFNDTEAGRRALMAYKRSSWAEGKEGKERRDENEPDNDIMDSVEYFLTRHMNALLRAGKGDPI